MDLQTILKTIQQKGGELGNAYLNNPVRQSINQAVVKASKDNPSLRVMSDPSFIQTRPGQDAISHLAVGATLAGGDMATVPQALISQMKSGAAMPTNEQIVEKAGGWAPGARSQFDLAMFTKDAQAVKDLLPQVPAEYKVRFAQEIANLLGTIK